MIETYRKRRGHAFLPPKAVSRKVPAIGTTDGQGQDAIVHVHYFTSSGDWYITEADFETGEVFGWAELLPGCGELGYSNLHELEDIYVPPFHIVERDMHWAPKPLREVVR